MKLLAWLRMKAGGFFASPDVCEVLRYAKHELKNLAKFVILILVAIAAHVIVEYLEQHNMSGLKIVFQVVEYGALIIGATEYLGQLAIKAWKSLTGSSSP